MHEDQARRIGAFIALADFLVAGFMFFMAYISIPPPYLVMAATGLSALCPFFRIILYTTNDDATRNKIINRKMITITLTTLFFVVCAGFYISCYIYLLSVEGANLRFILLIVVLLQAADFFWFINYCYRVHCDKEVDISGSGSGNKTPLLGYQ